MTVTIKSVVIQSDMNYIPETYVIVYSSLVILSNLYTLYLFIFIHDGLFIIAILCFFGRGGGGGGVGGVGG